MGLWKCLLVLVVVTCSCVVSLEAGHSGIDDEEVSKPDELTARGDALKAEGDDLAARAEAGCGHCGEQANAKYIEAAKQGSAEAGIMWAYRCNSNPALGFPSGCDAEKALSFVELATKKARSTGMALFAGIKAAEWNFQGFGTVRNFTRGCEFLQTGIHMLTGVMAVKRIQGHDADELAAELVGSQDGVGTLYFNHGTCVHRGGHHRLANPAERATGLLWALRARLAAPKKYLPDFSTVFGPHGEPTYVGMISWGNSSTSEPPYVEPWFIYLWLEQEHGQWLVYLLEGGFLGIETVRIDKRAGNEIVLISEDGSTRFDGFLEGGANLRGTMSQRGGARGDVTLRPPEAIRVNFSTDHAAIAEKRGTSFRLANGTNWLAEPRKLEQACDLQTKENCNAEHLQAHALFLHLRVNQLRAIRADLYEDAYQGCPASPKLAARCTWDAWQAQHRLFVLEQLLSEMEAGASKTEL
mmetsp:Transcript_96913/g.273945  ORF Transcript_96913/g.273945 Transcript_96913/m.273945 type:complete len:469 (-) Transcript_96913:81-1487(-)